MSCVSSEPSPPISSGCSAHRRQDPVTALPFFQTRKTLADELPAAPAAHRAVVGARGLTVLINFDHLGGGWPAAAGAQAAGNRPWASRVRGRAQASPRAFLSSCGRSAWCLCGSWRPISSLFSRSRCLWREGRAPPPSAPGSALGGAQAIATRRSSRSGRAVDGAAAPGSASPTSEERDEPGFTGRLDDLCVAHRHGMDAAYRLLRPCRLGGPTRPMGFV